MTPYSSPVLVCPESKLRLTSVPIEAAVDKLDDGRGLSTRRGLPADLADVSSVLMREDGACGFPELGRVPVLMAPEAFVASGSLPAVDVSDPRYAEAYDEDEYYSTGAETRMPSTPAELGDVPLGHLIAAAARSSHSFPEPRGLWIDAIYDCAAQHEAYRHLAPVAGKRILQLGGIASHAVKFLLVGAAESWLLTPMIGEARASLRLARAAGVEDRLHCVVGIGEELPFEDAAFDAIYSGGSIHHTVTPLSLFECRRVLRAGGRFAAVDPWRTPFYRIGIAVFGKREPIHCRPLNPARVAPLYEAFSRAQVVHHGALTRYPLLVLQKLGVSASLGAAWWINRVDDLACSMAPGLRRLGSSVTLLGTVGLTD